MTSSPLRGTSPDVVPDVDSLQRAALRRPIVDATVDGALELGVRYWAELRRSTRGVVRVRIDDEGVGLALASVVTLMKFGPPEPLVRDDAVECRFPILGGRLVARPGGWLVLAQRSDPELGLVVGVTGYSARLAGKPWEPLRRLLYTAVQAPLHRLVSRRFLERAARGLP